MSFECRGHTQWTSKMKRSYYVSSQKVHEDQVKPCWYGQNGEEVGCWF